MQSIAQWVFAGGLCLGMLLAAPMATAFLGDDAIPISSIEELQLIGNDPDYPRQKDYFLTGDIDASETATWNPDGNGGFSGFEPISYFDGKLDGRGYTISGLYINRPSESPVGLFGQLAAFNIANLSITGAFVAGDEDVGILAGTLNADVKNCHVEGDVIGASLNTGGFAGRISGVSAIVEACSASGSAIGASQVGGFTGSTAFEAIVRRSSAESVVSGADTVGGFSGIVRHEGLVSQCYAVGQVSGTERIGGFVGELFLATVDNCYATGSVSGDAIVGGFVGQGGPETAIVNAYSTGLVDGESDTGGFHGAGAIAITNCFWDEDSSGISTSFSGESRTTQEMQTQSTFAALWDFGTVWDIIEGKSYPFFATNAQFPPPGITNYIDVSTLNELELIGNHPEFPLDAYYALSNDIDASASATQKGSGGFVPIGTDASPFTGVFDGRGRHIRDLSIDHGATDNSGFIGVLGSTGTVRRLGLVGGSVSGGNNTGAIVGHNQGGRLQKSFSALSVQGALNTGGLVGLNEGAIEYCYATGDVTGTEQVGGLVGDNTTGAIFQSYAAGIVSGNAALGGLTGIGDGTTESYWDSDASGLTTSGGGSPLTAVPMRLTEAFAPEWDFDVVWDIIDSRTYPFLRANVQDPFPGALPIASIDELQLIGNDLNYPSNRYYYLANDIDAGVTATWNSGAGFAPIAAGFSGTLDGRGHIIRNLHIDRPTSNDVGIFSAIGNTARIVDIGIIDALVSGQSNVGILVGNMTGGTVDRAYVTGSLTASSENAGGLAGRNSGEIRASYALVSIQAHDHAGGLVGRNAGGSIRKSYAYGSVSGNFSVGGLTGTNQGGIFDCFSNASVSANMRGGGLVGSLENGVLRSLATGLVESSPPAGGFSGDFDFLSGPSVVDSFWDTLSTGQSTSSEDGQFRPTGLPTETLRLRDTYEPPWNMFEIWGIADGLSYPYLRGISFVLTGVVTFQDGTPVPNTTVLSDLDGFDTITNESGEFALILPAPYTGAIAIESDLATVPQARAYTDQRESLSFQSFVVFRPTITLLGEQDMVIECGESFEDPGATAEDGDANDISGSIIVTGTVDTSVLGTYSLFYDAEDEFGIAATTKERTVQVVDSAPPVIELIGPATLQLECDASFEDPGASAMDICDGVVSVNASGTVDANTPGIYEIQYTASDTIGNDAVPLTRTVTVVDTTAPDVVLNGSATMELECGDAFSDPLAEVTDNCDDLDLQVSGEVDTTTPGSYTVLYSAVDSAGNEAQTAARIVTVVDTTAPVVALVGSETIEVECETAFSDPGVSVSDSCDLDPALNTSNTVETDVPGNYTVTYQAVDANGNESTAVVRQVIVVDTSAPTVSLNGQADMTIPCGGDFDDPGATASDACDGTLQVTVSGTVDVNQAGDYTLVYTATDVAANTGTATRTITVLDDCSLATHSGDIDGDGIVSLSELLRVIQFFNTGTYHCAATPDTTEDGYVPSENPEAQDCIPHASDFNPQDWSISLSELLRLIQFFNTGAYHECQDANPPTEDGYCPGPPPPPPAT